MADAETRAKLKALYQALAPRPLGPENPAYVDIHAGGDSPIERVATTIEFAEGGSLQLLGAQVGTGGSTALRALQSRLGQDSKFVVIVGDLQPYLPVGRPIGVIELFLAAVGALTHAPELVGADEDGSWKRFSQTLSNTAARAGYPNLDAWLASLEVKELWGKESTTTRWLKNGVSTTDRIRNGSQRLVQVALRVMRQRRGEDAQLVVAYDGLRQLQGLASMFEPVAASIERVFVEHANMLRFPSLHVVYMTPPWLRRRLAPVAHAYDGVHQLTAVKVRDREGLPNPGGIDLLRRIARHRGDDENWLEWLLGDETAFDELALASGGRLRDLLRLLRALIVEANASLPVSAQSRQHAIRQLHDELTASLTNRDVRLLLEVEKSGTLEVENAEDLVRLDELLDLGILLPYRSNGRDWYGVHPAALDSGEARDGDERSGSHEGSEPHDTPAPATSPALRLARVELDQIRCFEHMCFEFEADTCPSDWTLVLGDNAHGKSTLLRSIALGLCAESEAAALLEATPGPLLRLGQDKGRITLTLVDTEDNHYRSVTEVTPDPEGDPDSERLRRVEWELPPDQVFVCAYGANRTRTADLSHTGYSRHDAVRSLFDDETSLQNPELILRRQAPAKRKQIERKLLEILMLDERSRIQYSSTRGVEILGPWASGEWIYAGLQTLSDGYRSTTQWVIDLIGWLVYAGRFASEADMTGIVLIDELEQHLHPRWQRYIVELLREQFPGLQFIASTHTPLLALGLADLDHSLLIQLDKDHEQQVQARHVDPREFRGQRADQILTSPKGFGLPTTRSLGSAGDIARYAELASMQRGEAEEREFVELRAHLDETLVLGETAYERRVEAAVRAALAKLASETPQPGDEAEEYELRRQLAELFNEETAP